MSDRHYRRRARAKALRADTAVLIERLLARFSAPAGTKVAPLSDREARMLSEMLQRLDPPRGVKAPIILTDFRPHWRKGHRQ